MQVEQTCEQFFFAEFCWCIQAVFWALHSLTYFCAMCCISQNTKQTGSLPFILCEFASDSVFFSFTLDLTLGSDSAAAFQKPARWTVFLGFLFLITKLRDSFIYILIKKKIRNWWEVPIIGSIICLFQNRGFFFFLLSRAISHSVVVCRLVFLRFPLLVLNPGWVSFFSHNIWFIDHCRGVAARRRRTDTQTWSL